MNVFPALVNYSNGSAAYFDDDMPEGMWMSVTVLYIALAIATIMGNFGVLLLTEISSRMRGSMNILTKNMSIANMIIGILSIPFHSQSTLSKTWYLPHFLCAFCSYVQVLSSCATVFSLTAIAVIQYRTVIEPHSLKPSKRHIRFLIVAIWVLSVIIALPIAISRRVTALHEPEIDLYVCMNINLTDEWMEVYSILVSVVQYFLPITVMSTIYIRIGFKLRVIRPFGNPEQSHDEYISPHERKIIKMTAVTVILFGLYCFPFQLYRTVLHYQDSIRKYKHIRLVWFFCDWLAMLNCCCSSFINMIYNEAYTQELRQLFRTLRRRPDDAPSVNDIIMAEL